MNVGYIMAIRSIRNWRWL